MTAFRQLPFQFQQRGPDLSEAKDTKLAKFIEQRDQDLENYLANLPAGAASNFSLVSWDFAPASPGDELIGTPWFQPTWAPAFNSGDFDASGVWSGDPNATVTVHVIWNVTSISSTMPGFVQLSFDLGIDSRLHMVPIPAYAAITPYGITYPSLAVGVSASFAGWGSISATPLPADIQTSTGAFETVDSLKLQSAQLSVLAV